ncbi:MAG: ribosome maturation factor RimM [Bacteroidales bacterium]|jgi:16S rRNA processing protein RimM|nr:ribosome maturation factor RimM [Bacteroidales bacterium]
MGKDDFYYLGKILKTHGNKGHVLAVFEADDPENYEKLESVFIDLHGERIPLFIETIELKSPWKAFIHFKDTESPEEAEAFTGLEMFLPMEKLPPQKKNQFYFHEIIGFTVVDEKYGNVGIIKDILEYPQQTLFQICYKNKEILIPAVSEMIHRVDRKKKVLEVKTPEGLIDLYL